MSRLLRLVAALALAAGVSAVPIAQVAACSCMQMSLEEAAAAVEIVFTGTVVHQEPTDGKGGPFPMPAPAEGGMILDRAVMAPGPTLYLFEVDGVAKGDVGSQATLLGGGNGADCGMSFGLDERWLVFATVQGDVLTTSLCAGNVMLGPDETPPIPVTSPTASPGSAPGGLPIGILLPVAAIAGLVGLSAFIFWRADRPT